VGKEKKGKGRMRVPLSCRVKKKEGMAICSVREERKATSERAFFNPRTGQGETEGRIPFHDEKKGKKGPSSPCQKKDPQASPEKCSGQKKRTGPKVNSDKKGNPPEKNGRGAEVGRRQEEKEEENLRIPAKEDGFGKERNESCRLENRRGTPLNEYTPIPQRKNGHLRDTFRNSLWKKERGRKKMLNLNS